MVRNPNDGRCLRTRQAVEEALYNFYSAHSYFEKITIRRLCRDAKISAQSFYRNYRGIYDVILGKDAKIETGLLEAVDMESSFMVGLARMFNFVKKNGGYFKINLFQERGTPFEIILKIFEPKILKFVQLERKRRRAAEIDQRICAEVKNYLIFKLVWWIEKDEFDDEKLLLRIDEIITYTKERILEMEKQLSRR